MSYLILCLKDGRSRRLGRALWWRPNSRGYTTIIEEAGRYTREECDRICRPGENIAVPEHEALEKAVNVVVDFGCWEDRTAKEQANAPDDWNADYIW